MSFMQLLLDKIRSTKQSVVGIRTVLDDTTHLLRASISMESLDGGECGTDDSLSSFHHALQCFPVRHRAVAIPNCDPVGKDALDGAAVEVHQNLRRQMDLL